MKNLSESILYNIHKSEEINKKQLKLFKAGSLSSALEDLYMITVGGGDGLLCWTCAQDEK